MAPTEVTIISPARFGGVVVIMVLACFCRAEAVTITAKSASFSDIRAAVDSAADGDTVSVPAGTVSWASTLTIKKGIILQGAGNDETVILDDLPRRGSQSRQQTRAMRSRQSSPKQPRRDLPTASAINRNKLTPAVGFGRGLLRIELRPGQSFRLTGFTFRKGSVAEWTPNGVVYVTGTSPSVRIDHCHFDQLIQIGIWFDGWIYGVVDHCRWDVSVHMAAMSVNNGATWGGGMNKFGDGSWAASTEWGSEKFLFVEDCVFNNLTPSPSAAKIDGQNGGRFVSRFNQYINTSVLSGHGTESGGRHRGIRAAEFYCNTRTGSATQGWGETRSGTRLYHHNTWTGPNKGAMPLNVHREFFPFPAFDGATGSNPWDMNDTEGNGTWVEGHAPHLYASGTAASDSTMAGETGVLTSSGNPGWQNDALKDMILVNTSQLGKNGGVPCRIFSNTGNTITFNSDSGGYGGNNSPSKRFAAGEKFVVYRVLAALDQVGRGQCDLLAGRPPINTVTRTKSWPHQVLDPIYAFENRTNGTLTPVLSRFPTVKENRDYYNQTTSFDGSAGIGVGKLAERPSTCTPGVAYWATDQGEWNSTHDGPDGQLYVCTAPNTWSLYYKPYTYPHPLVSGKPAPSGKTAQDQGQADTQSSSNK